METIEQGVVRREGGLIEHICRHGIGHPNFYSATRLDQHFDHTPGTWMTHGCDGCCDDPQWPGRKLTDSEIVARLGSQINAWSVNGDTEQLGALS